MLSKNNYKERLRKMEPRQDRFSIRKFSVGAASVLIGFLFIGMSNGEEVNADTLTLPDDDAGHPEQESGSNVDSGVPNKVVVDQQTTPETQTQNDASDQQVTVDHNDDALKSTATDDSKVQETVKDQTEQKTQEQVSQTPKSDSSVKPETQKTEQTNDQANANADAQKADSAAQKAEQSTDKAIEVEQDNKNDLQTKTEDTTLNNATKTNPVEKQSDNDKQDIPDITVDSEVSEFQTEYKNLQDNFAKLGAAERNREAAKVQADYEKLDTQAKEKFALAYGINQQLYSVNDGVADVSSFAEFTQALCDKNVTTINLTQDITADDNQSALVSGGTSGSHHTLSNYELSADDSFSSKYKKIARTVTIEGNHHTLDMNKWSISFSRQNYGDNPWEFTFKDMTLKTNCSNTDYGPLYFFHTDDTFFARKSIYSKDLAKTKVKFENTTIDSTNALMDSQINVEFSGTNTINGSYNGALVNAANITIDDGTTIINDDNGTTALKAGGTIAVGNGSKVKISAKGQDMVAPNINIGDNATVNLTDAENTDLGNFDNNAISFTDNMDVGDGSTININTGDAKPAANVSVHNVRGIYGNTNTKNKNYASLHFRKNDHVNMDMGTGHSTAIMVDNMDVDEGTEIIIHTKQNNNNDLNHNELGGNANFFHYSPVTMAWDGSGEMHLKSGAKLQIIRNIQNDHTATPLISFGDADNGNAGIGKSRNYTMTVDGGATLDLQDDASSDGFSGHFDWSGYLSSNCGKNIFAPGMLAMFGTESRDTLQLGSYDGNGNYVAPAYINLQRTGDQWGQLIKLEGKATSDIHNKTILYGNAPIAQWNSDNKTNKPSNAWNIQELITQNGGGDTGNNFVAADVSKLTGDGFVKSDAAQGVSLGQSNGTVVMPGNPNDKDSYVTYSDPDGKKGVITGNKQELMKLQNMLDNFNWWKARRIAYGTDLLKTNGGHDISINPSDLYTPTVVPQTYLENKYENNAKDFENNKVITGLTDVSGKQITTGLDSMISKEEWGIDWTHTEFKNIVDADGKIDQTKLDALKTTTGKDPTQQYDDIVEYTAFNSFISSINNPDGSTGYDPTKTQFKLSDSTKEEQTYNIPMTVTYSDGSTSIALVPVTVKKAKLNTQYQPSYGTTTVKQVETANIAAPTFKSSVENPDGSITYTDATAPSDVTYAITTGATKPDFVTLNSNGSIDLAPRATDNTGVYSIPITVTYSDNSTDNISALVDVTDGKSTVIWGKKNPDGSVKGAVVVKPGAVTIHKTTGSSSSINSMDAKKGVSEIDVYSQNATDPTKLDDATYSYKNGDFVDSQGTSIGSVNIAYPDTYTLNTTTTDNATTLPVDITFNSSSLPAQNGVIENGAKTSVNESVNLAGASALSNDNARINLPVDYDVSADSEGYFSSENLKKLVDHSALDNIDPDFAVDGYSIENKDLIDTNRPRTQELTIRINFKDKMGGSETYLDVTIPSGINVTTGDAGKYNPTYTDVVDNEQQGVTVIAPKFDNGAPSDGNPTYALGTTSEQNLPENMKQYVHVDSGTGAITIDAGAMGDTASYEIPVTVTYKDGTTDNAVANVYEVKGKEKVTDPYSASEAISNFQNLPSGTTAKWDTIPDPHKYSQDVPVDVTLPDGKDTSVNVTVINSNALKPNTTTIYGQDETTTITIETPSYHKTSSDNYPAKAPRVSKITIINDKGVTTTYTLTDDGKYYQAGDGSKFSADEIKTNWEDGHKLNTNSSNFGTDGTKTTLRPTYPIAPDETSDEWDDTKNSKYRVNIIATGAEAKSILNAPDGNVGWCNAYANIYGATAAKANDDNNQLKATHNVESSLADASKYVDTTDLTADHNSGVKNVTWNTKPDLTQVKDNASGSVDINFNDGTKLTIPVSIDVVQSDADKFEKANTDKNPLTQTISVHKDDTVAAGDAIKGFSDETKTTYAIVADGTQFNENVPTTEVGTKPYAATVKFADGSSTTVNIPVKVYTDASNFNEANKNKALTQEITEKMGSTVPNTDAKNGVKEDPTNIYHIIWTDTDNLKAPRFNGTVDTSTLTSDINPDKSYEATVYFEDGTSTIVNIPVKIVASDASKFAQDNTDNALVKTISKGKGYVFKDTDASQGVKEDPTNTYHIIWTDKDNLKAPRFDDASKIDTSKKASATPYDATIYFEDGTKLGVKIPVIITDEATDNQDNLKTKTYQVDQGGTVTADQVIDTTASKNIPEGTKYAWGNKTPDTNKVGTQDVTITATYPDGTKGTVDGKVTVEATPETTTVTLHQGVDPTDDDATSSITNLVPAGQDGMPQSVKWKTTPSTETPGKANATVTVTYSDGYTKDVTVPINVWKTTKGSDVTTPSDDTHDIYREITRTITVDGAEQPVQKVVFTRDKYTDTTDASAKPTYSDWVAKDGKTTFDASGKLTKDGYTAAVTGKDINGHDIVLTSDGTIAAETVTADSQSENITVTNTANDQIVTIKFINTKGDSEVSVDHPKTFSGKTDSEITINKDDITVPDHYKLDKDSGLPATYKFTSAKDQTITVKLDHLTTFDPTNPDDAKDPKNSDMFESIKRTINYTDPTQAGAEPQSEIQTVKYQRTKTVNDSDSNDITYGDWTPVDSTKTAWDAYDVPTFEDYTVTAKDEAGKPVTITNGQIAGKTLEPGNGGKTTTADQTITLTYTMTDAGHFKHDNENNAAIQLIRVKRGTDKSTIDGKQGIKPSEDYTVQSVTFTNPFNIDTSKASPLDKPFPTYEATVTFGDNSTAKVNIPIQVYDKATDFEQANTKNPLTREVDEKKGATVPATDAVKGFKDEVISKYGIVSTGDNAPKFNTAIDTSKVTETTTDYEATVNFDDGSSAIVKIPVKIVASDASAFDDANKDNALVKQITWGKGTSHEASEAIDGIQKQADYHVTDATFTTVPSTDAVHAAQNFEATVNFEDGTKTTVQIPVAITDKASDYDPQATKDPVKTPQGTQVDPKDVVDPTTLPTDPKDTPTITWTDPTDPTKIPDPDKPGTQTADVDIKYPDGTVDHVQGKVTVEATPDIGSISTLQNVVPDLTKKDNAKQVVTNLNNGNETATDGYPATVAWTTDPDVSSAGQTTGNVTITYADGYKVTRDVPINVIGVEDGKDEANHGDGNVYKDFTRTIRYENGIPQVQHVILTRIKYTDTSKPEGQQISYSDWESDNSTFAAVDVSKPGYTANATDGKGKTIDLIEGKTIASETISLKDSDVRTRSANETIVINYTANQHTLIINYVNAADKTGAVFSTQAVQGRTDETVSINLKYPDGYQVNADDKVPTEYKFTATSSDEITVKLDKINEVNPDPTKKTDPDQQDLFETITRTFTYTDPTTGQAVTETQGVDFERSKKVNNTTKAVISYGDWHLVSAIKNTWPEYTVPTFDDYTVTAKDEAGNGVDITNGKIASQTVTADTKNTTITLTYTETEAGKFKDKNKDNSQVQTILVHQGTDPATVKASDGIKDFDKLTGAKVAFKDGTTIDTETLGKQNYPATITFGDKSTAEVSIPIKVYTEASIFNEDNAKNPLAQTIHEKQGTVVDPGDAKNAFDSDVVAKYDIDMIDHAPNFNEKIDTSKVTTTATGYDATVTFKDGSHTVVKVPVIIDASDASRFQDAVKDNSAIVKGITVHKYDTVAASDAKNGIEDPATYKVTSATFDTDVDTKTTGSKDYPVTVTFEDGSSTSVQMPVKVVDSDASKFKDNYNTETQPVEEMLHSTVPASDALKGIKDKDADNVNDATFNYNVDTSKTGSKDYDATVTFKDGSSTVVPITVKVVSLADKFDDTADLQTIGRKVGEEVKSTDAIEGVVDPSTHGVSGAVFNENVPTDTVGSNPYNATLTFTDGSKKDVEITVKVGDSDASAFDPNANLKDLVKIHVGTEIDPTDTKNAKDALKDPNDSKITGIQYVTVPDTSKAKPPFTTPIKITFEDGSTKTVQQAVQITSDADEYTGIPQNVDIPHGSIIDPTNTNNAKGGATDPDKTIDHIQFNDPTDIDTSTLGKKQKSPATITFKDGSTKTIVVPTTITPNDADKFDPNDLNSVTVNKGDTIKSGDEVPGAIDPEKKTKDDVNDITYQSVPDTTKPGKQTPTVKITFKDGSSTTANLPVTVTETKTGNKYQAGTDGVNDADNHYIYREILVHNPDTNAETIITQSIHFIRKDKNGNSSYTVDGKTTYVPWTVADDDGNSTGTNVGHFKEYDVPAIADYKASQDSVADEKVEGDAYSTGSPVSNDRDTVEKIDITYSPDMKQISFDYLAVPASFTPADGMTLQLAAYDIKSGKRIKMPKGISFAPKLLPEGVKLDAKTGNLIVPKGMKIGASDAKVEAVAITGQKEVAAHLNVVGNDSGQTQPGGQPDQGGQSGQTPTDQPTSDQTQPAPIDSTPATEPQKPVDQPADDSDADSSADDESDEDDEDDEDYGDTGTPSMRHMAHKRSSGAKASKGYSRDTGVHGEYDYHNGSNSNNSPLASVGATGRNSGSLGENGANNNAGSEELPQTGEDNSGLGALGLVAASLSLIGLAGVRKRKHN